MITMRKEVLAIGSILVVALTAALVHAAVLGNLPQIFETVENTSNQTVSVKGTFVGPALSLVRTGSLSSEGKHIGFVQRGPGYAVALAGAFLLFGERMVAIFLVNLLSLLLAIIFLWRISTRFLPGPWQYAPPFMLALFWETSAFVWLGSYELFTMAIATFTVFSFLKYRETRHCGWLSLSSLFLAFLVLERPILLYSVPIVFFLPVLWNRKVFSHKKLIFHLGMFIIIVVAVVGAWSLRNHIVIGTWQLGSGGHILLRRATQLDFSAREVISMYLSYAFGDLIGDVLYDGFPKDKEPRYWDADVEKRIDETRDRGGSLAKLDHLMYQDAISKIKEKPLKFFITGFSGVFRLNSPMNYNTLELMRVFVGDNHSLTKGLRILFIVAVRFLWYSFLVVVSVAFIWHARDFKAWGLILGVVLYYNITYSLLTHAEVRYILTVMPFYFLLCAEGLRLINKRYLFVT